MTDKKEGVYGLCLRGKAGWGENVALITSMANSFGARWFDENCKPQFNTPEWENTLQYYVDVMKESGPAGSSETALMKTLHYFKPENLVFGLMQPLQAHLLLTKKIQKLPIK